MKLAKNTEWKLNVKKTKKIVISKSGGTQCKIMINGIPLEQVLQYKYLGSWITEDGKCEIDVKARIDMAKDAFWKHKELLQGKINLRIKKRILQCYVFLVMKYGCESWTLNKDLTRRINAFEMWCYRRILKIKWTELIPNNAVLKRMKVDNPLLYSNIIKQKLNIAGHILRGSSDQSALLILEGKLNGINKQGHPRRM